MLSHGIKQIAVEKPSFVKSATRAKQTFQARCRSYSSDIPPKRSIPSRHLSWIRPYVAAMGMTTVLSLAYFYGSDIRLNTGSGQPTRADVIVEEPGTRKNLSLEEGRESLSS